MLSMLRDKPSKCYKKESINAVLLIDRNGIQGQRQGNILYGLKI